jgi:cyclic pyranopterin phosphate synthase
MKRLSHTDDKGKARMVDVGDKPDQVRIARAEGFIQLKENTLELIKENEIKKGDVLATAQIAGIQGGKQTSDLIPLCHPLQISKIAIKTSIEEEGIRIIAEAKCTGKTGVEMEALTAVSIALLTIYDMCKAVDDTMIISNIHLVEKVKSDK